MPYATALARRLNQRKYYWANHERVLASQRKYTAKNRAKMQKKAREWLEKNRARVSAHSHLRQLRALEELTPRQIAKCAQIIAQYPKRRENSISLIGAQRF